MIVMIRRRSVRNQRTSGPDRGQAEPAGQLGELRGGRGEPTGGRQALSRRRLWARRRVRAGRGVRSAKEWCISTCRTVPGTGIAITSPLRLFPLRPVGESFARTQPHARATGITPPGFASGPNPGKSRKPCSQVLRPYAADCQRKSAGFRASGAKVLAGC